MFYRICFHETLVGLPRGRNFKPLWATRLACMMMIDNGQK